MSRGLTTLGKDTTSMEYIHLRLLRVELEVRSEENLQSEDIG